MNKDKKIFVIIIFFLITFFIPYNYYREVDFQRFSNIFVSHIKFNLKYNKPIYDLNTMSFFQTINSSNINLYQRHNYLYNNYSIYLSLFYYVFCKILNLGPRNIMVFSFSIIYMPFILAYYVNKFIKIKSIFYLLFYYMILYLISSTKRDRKSVV